MIALQRTGDPGRLSCLRPHLDILTNIDPSSESEVDTFNNIEGALINIDPSSESEVDTFNNIEGAWLIPIGVHQEVISKVWKIQYLERIHGP